MPSAARRWAGTARAAHRVAAAEALSSFSRTAPFGIIRCDWPHCAPAARRPANAFFQSARAAAKVTKSTMPRALAAGLPPCTAGAGDEAAVTFVNFGAGEGDTVRSHRAVPGGGEQSARLALAEAMRLSRLMPTARAALATLRVRASISRKRSWRRRSSRRDEVSETASTIVKHSHPPVGQHCLSLAQLLLRTARSGRCDDGSANRSRRRAMTGSEEMGGDGTSPAESAAPIGRELRLRQWRRCWWCGPASCATKATPSAISW